MAAREAKRRDVLQLLREYRAFKTAFGGATAAEDSHLKSAEYGSGGLTLAGAYYDHLYPGELRQLRESYAALDKALAFLRERDYQAYLMLIRPYLGDPADPSVVDEWRKKQKMVVRGRMFTVRHDRAMANHDLAVEVLVERLADTELYVDFPKRSTSTEAESVEKRNDALYAAYRRLTDDEGKSKTKAVKEAAALCDYTERRAWQIVGLREA